MFVFVGFEEPHNTTITATVIVHAINSHFEDLPKIGSLFSLRTPSAGILSVCKVSVKFVFKETSGTITSSIEQSTKKEGERIRIISAKIIIPQVALI